MQIPLSWRFKLWRLKYSRQARLPIVLLLTMAFFSFMASAVAVIQFGISVHRGEFSPIFLFLCIVMGVTFLIHVREIKVRWRLL